ncbi:iron transporter FeoA [Prosthecochloris sp. GSB1]|uniref:FeoA family protein n=1 Tax=Prosthecochloris sp. GSB1 TaxID=281093 RepID=UPI000B8CB3BD|nr:ferrous iron transport protein A [Prosthecochloris sp. GSB1]ASQ91004.1 iron transporter FeoA [Prosthecochloris sp. GSB1]
MTLAEMITGQSARIGKLSCSGALKSRLVDMGVLGGERVRVERIAPLGDPVEISVRQCKLSLRRKDAEGITVEEVG